jgi:hypothetical protein
VTLCNVDPNNPVNTASPAAIRAKGFAGVRYVSRRGLDDWVVECQAAGLYVLACITEQSEGYVPANADLVQIGNEPDIVGTADSMDAVTFAGYLQLYRRTYPELPMITGALASGQPTYLRNVRDAGGLNGFLGVGLHYPSEATTFASYKRYASGLPFYVTEWWRPAERILEYRTMLRQAGVVLDAWFSWGYQEFALSLAQERALRAAA